MTGMIRASLAALALASLVGCGSDAERTAVWGTLRDAAKATGQARKAPPPSGPPELTPAQVDGSPLRLLLLEIESSRRGTAMALISTNSGTETYSSADASTVTLRDGVLIATRGIVPDLMSALAPGAQAIARGEGSHRRQYHTLAGDDSPVTQTYDCQLRSEGRETLAIAGRRHDTRRVIETCEGEGRSFENRYWIDGRGKIRQSSQWTGTTVGKLRLSDPQK